MATGHYRCSSNRATVTDAAAIRALLTDYNTQNQCSFDGSTIGFDSPSDTLNISKNGQGAVIAFLSELAPLLDETLRVTNYVEPPYQEASSYKFIVQPSGDVTRLEDDGSRTQLVPA